MKVFALILIVLISSNLFSQNRIYHNQQSYESTDAFTYNQNAKSSFGVAQDETIDLSIGKKGSGGIILLQKLNDDFFNKDIMILGSLFLYLSDGSVIKCIDRKLYGYTDDTASVMYFLTSIEIEKLKHNDIESIGYSLAMNFGDMIDSSKNFTATNKNSHTSEGVLELF